MKSSLKQYTLFIYSITSTALDEVATFDEYGRYIMKNFDDVKPMSNFLAGLGGLWGYPMVRGVSYYGVFHRVRWRYFSLCQKPEHPPWQLTVLSIFGA